MAAILALRPHLRAPKTGWFVAPVVMAALLLAACGGNGEAANGTSGVPATLPAESAEVADQLTQALETMRGLSGYTVDVAISVGDQEATLTGTFGARTEVEVTQANGTRVLVRLDGPDAEVSYDGGETYEADSTNSFAVIAELPQAVLSGDLLDQGIVLDIGEAEIDGETVCQLQIGKFSAWLAKSELGPVVRRVSGPGLADDVPEFDFVVTYSDLVDDS